MQKNSANPGFRSLLITLLLLMFLLPASKLVSCSTTTAGDHSESNIYGIVVCSEGLPIEEIEVRLFAGGPHRPDTSLFLSVTGNDGFFEFEACNTGGYIIELNGRLGTGRVKVNAGTRADTVRISYPVTERVVILHNNDTHFTHNLPAEFSEKIRQVKDSYDDVFLFHAGDVFVRHPLRWIVNGRLMRGDDWYGERAAFMVTTMNELGYDLMTPGNHEFDYREPYTRQALDLAEFPLLSANIEISTGAFPPLEPYVVLQTSTWRKMAVLGLSAVSGNKEGILKHDELETARGYITLRDSADILVALTHIGLRTDRRLAREFPEFDLIVGGHSHDLLEEGEVVNSVLIAHAGGNPHIVSDRHPVMLGKVILHLENGVVVSKEARVIQIEAEENGDEEQVEDYYDAAGITEEQANSRQKAALPE